MGIGVQTSGVHHVALRSTDLARARGFYAETLGFPVVLELPTFFIFMAGSTAIAIEAPSATRCRNTIASTRSASVSIISLSRAPSEAELERVASALAAAGRTEHRREDGRGPGQALRRLQGS